jgi:hypothetical protein
MKTASSHIRLRLLQEPAVKYEKSDFWDILFASAAPFFAYFINKPFDISTP